MRENAMRIAAKWTIALTFSLAAHAGAAIAFLPDTPLPPLDAVRGGAEMEVAMLGNAFEETLEAGAVSETINPVETPPDATDPVQPETAAAEVETIAPEAPPEVVSEVVPDAVPAEADIILPADAPPPVVAQEPEVLAALPPVATVVPERKPEPKVVETPLVRKPVKKAAPRRSGKEGEAKETVKKGRADGAETAVATTAGRGSTSREAGNASFSNYEGKVRSKLNRSVRYPSRAETRGVKGVVHLQFVIAANGAVSGVRVTKSGGSPVLDTAALEAARRASPFPKIPQESGRSSWTFTVPIQFTR
jgi:protein TonB